MPSANATTRFSDRVENYVRYRPTYPADVLDVLRARTGLAAGQPVADVGSGTGISAKLFLDAGHPVYAVEPNAEMRAAAEAMLGDDPRFHSVAGSAEATTLPDASVDYVVAAQAFHWFDPAAVAPEWRRIVRPGGWIVLLWNTRQTGSTPFLRAYEALLRQHGTDYTSVNHENVTDDALRAALGRGYTRHVVPNAQVFDFEALKGRLLSSSYAPNVDHPGHAPMLDALRRIFDEHQRDGRVRFEYDTKIYLGRVA